MGTKRQQPAHTLIRLNNFTPPLCLHVLHPFDWMQNHFVLVVLLAGIGGYCAHARTQAPSRDEITPTPVLKAPTTPNPGSDNFHLDTSKSTRSVVQDWNAVCKQLCGAGLGGPICNPQCREIQHSHKDNQTERANYLLQGKDNTICQDLCVFNLGGSVCRCQQRIVDTKSSPNMVCSTFCENNDLTLTGCSICQYTDYTTAIPIQLPTTIRTTSTTPNWDQVCVALCKTGDGGALCNCDLPPFL